MSPNCNGLVKAKTDAAGIVVYEGQAYASDLDLMSLVQDGHVLSDLATSQTVKDLNYAWQEALGVDLGKKYFPFQHEGRITFFTKGDPVIYPKLRQSAREMPDYVANFELDGSGNLMVTVLNQTKYAVWLRQAAFADSFLDYHPWTRSDIDWEPWYARPPRRGKQSETTYPRPVKAEDAAARWDNHLGGGPYSNSHPRLMTPDLDRLTSVDLARSIRYGSHEMNSKPTKHHYHEETWTYDIDRHALDYANQKVNVPLPRGK